MNQFMQRYKEILGKEFEGLEELKPLSLKQSIRINPIKVKNELGLINRLEKEDAKLTKILFLEHGYYVESSRFSLGAAPEYLLGYYYVQEAAAQLPAQILAPKKSDVVLDMAAAPGGKLTQMAAMMENKGVLVGIDNTKHRMPALKNSIERMGVANSIIYGMDSIEVSKLNMEFDKILLDAPCSGNFLIDKDWFGKRAVAQFEERSQLQRELLMAGASVLKENGVLVYSTCSLEPEENEFVIDWAISNLGLKLEKLDPKEIGIGEPALTKALGKKLNPETSKCLRIWPHKTGTEGFFVAKFRK